MRCLKRFFLLVMLAVVMGSQLSVPTILRADEDFYGWGDDFDFDLGDDINLDDIESFEKENGISLKAGGSAPLSLNVIAAALSTIERPLFSNTRPPAGRDVLYLLPHKISAVEDGGVAVSMFYNMTNRMPFSIDSVFDRVAKFDDFITLITELLDVGDTGATEILSLLPLFKKITVQERRLGALIQAAWLLGGPFKFEAHTSLQVAERNFWISRRGQEEIAEIMSRLFTEESSVDQREFYRIAYGMGDTRLKLGVNTLNTPKLQVDCGVEMIVPTSKLSSTMKLRTDVDQVVPARDSVDTEELQENMLTLVKNFRDHLLRPRLGNNGHWGTGIYFESKVNFYQEMLHLWTRLSYDKLFAAREDRETLFQERIMLDALKNLDPNLSDEEKAQILNQFAKEFLFPSAFPFDVDPNGVFNVVLGLSATFNKWQLAGGYDYYMKQKERVRKLKSKKVCLSDLRIDDLTLGNLSQHKFYGEALYTIRNTKESKMQLGIGGDVTMKSFGIGHDWTAYFKFVASF